MAEPESQNEQENQPRTPSQTGGELGSGMGSDKPHHREKEIKVAGKNDICYYCKERGHWKCDCPKLAKDVAAEEKAKLEASYLLKGGALLRRATLAELQALEQRALHLQKVAADPNKVEPAKTAVQMQVAIKQAHVNAHMKSLQRVFGKTKLGLAVARSLGSHEPPEDEGEELTEEERRQRVADRRAKHRADLESLLASEAVLNDAALRRTIAQSIKDFDIQAAGATNTGWRKLQKRISVNAAGQERTDFMARLRAQNLAVNHSKEHMLELHKIFNEYDVGHKGVLDIQDMQALLHEFGVLDVGEKELVAAMKDIGVGITEGQLEFAEFESALSGTFPTGAAFVSVILNKIAELKQEQFRINEAKKDRRLKAGYEHKSLRGKTGLKTLAQRSIANTAFYDAGVERHNWEVELNKDLDQMTKRTLGGGVTTSARQKGAKKMHGSVIAPELPQGHRRYTSLKAARGSSKLLRSDSVIRSRDALYPRRSDSRELDPAARVIGELEEITIEQSP